MKKPLIIFGFVLLAGIITYRVFQMTTPTGELTTLPETNTETGNYLITIGDKGFFPRDLTIKLGETVTFENIDTIGHWPASDVHPSHEIYPEFDPKRSLVPGEKWSFTFDKPGLWRMHDHEEAIFEGSITVVDPTAPVSATPPAATQKPTDPAQPCPPTTTNFYCYENYYKQLVATKGVPTAMAELRLDYDQISYVRSQCHPITHVIGRAAIQLYPRVSEAYAHGDALCWSGYYHGVMEGIIGKIGRKNIVAQIDSICTDVPGKASYSFDYYNCVHGLGHGLMALSNNELFESLDLCDNLTGDWERTSCYGGAFMENVIVDNKNHYTKYLKPEDPIYPCNAVNVQHKQSCYLMQTSYMLKVSGNDFSKIFPLCRKVDAGYEATCFQSLGRDASGSTISDPFRTRDICNMGADETEKSNCLIGAVKDFISYHHSDVQAKLLCEMFSGNLKDICLVTTASYYATF